MTRRSAPSNPDSGPVSEFAAELRALRDRQGGAALNVDEISRREGIPRSTLYAVLRGSRLPSREALSALVRSWGGDEVEWMAKRTAVEMSQAGRSSGRWFVPGLKTPQWRTFPTIRTVLAVARTPASLARLMNVISPLESDWRIRLIFTVEGDRPYTNDTELALRELGAFVLSWRQAVDMSTDLTIAAHVSSKLKDIKGPLVVLPSATARFAKNATPAEAGQPPALLRAALVRKGVVFPAAIGLAHESQLGHLEAVSEEVAKRAHIIGDPIFERMLASQVHRSHYRSALGVGRDRALVVITSTWGDDSLLATYPDLVDRVVGQLPVDEYQVALVLHPHIWTAYGIWQMQSFLRSATDSGLALVTPESWQTAIIAADIVIGDHGSMTAYAKALGRPVRWVGSAPPDLPTEPSDSHRQDVAPLDVSGDLLKQIEPTVAAASLKLLDASAIPASPGKAFEYLRKIFYELLDLPEPNTPFRISPIGAPVRVQGVHPAVSCLVTAEVHSADRGVDEVVLRRFPFVSTSYFARPASSADTFAVCNIVEADPHLLQAAEVLVRTDVVTEGDVSAWSSEVIRRFPGAAMVVAALGSTCLARISESDIVLEFSVYPEGNDSPRLMDPMQSAAAVYAAFVKGRPLSSEGTISVRVGKATFTLIVQNRHADLAFRI